MIKFFYEDKLEKLKKEHESLTEEYKETQKLFIQHLLEFVGELIDLAVGMYRQNIVLSKKIKKYETKIKKLERKYETHITRSV